MIGLSDIDLKQTRFYQDVLAEGLSMGANRNLLFLIRRRFGTLSE
jgi:predicted transposase YdaD